MRYIFKKTIALSAIIFLFAGCNPFSTEIIAGLVKTSNGGADWTTANQIAGNTKTSLVNSTFSSLAFDPTKHTTIYAGSYNNGLFKSEDSGGTWTQILGKISIYDIAVHPTDPMTMYASGFAVGHGKLLKTTDGGKSWTEMYSEETADNAVRTVALNPANPNEVMIGLTSGNVVKSFDGGKNWVLVTNFEDRINRIRWQSSGIYLIMRTKGMYESIDGGSTWSDLTSGIIQKSNNSIGLFFSNTTGVQVFSQFAVSISDPSLIYVTTDQGVFKSTNTGSSWIRLPLPYQESKAAQGRAVAIAPNSNNVVYMSVGSTIYKTLDGGISFQTQGIATNGFVNYILIDPDLPQIAYSGIFAQ